jgi:hypothetical protein
MWLLRDSRTDLADSLQVLDPCVPKGPGAFLLRHLQPRRTRDRREFRTLMAWNSDDELASQKPVRAVAAMLRPTLWPHDCNVTCRAPRPL